MTERTKAEILANEERALRRVTELAYENTDLRRERDAALSEAARLRMWLRAMRRLPEVGITNIDGLSEHDRGREIPTAYLDAALRGEEPPRPPRRKR